MELTITSGFQEISRRLIEASAVAKGAVACAEAGSEREALRIGMDLDDVLQEIAAVHSAVRLLGRMQRDEA